MSQRNEFLWHLIRAYQKKKRTKIYLKTPSIMYLKFSVHASLFLSNVCFIGLCLKDQLNFFTNLNCQRFLNKVTDGQTFIIFVKCSLSRIPTWINLWPYLFVEIERTVRVYLPMLLFKQNLLMVVSMFSALEK